ncbi:MAG: trypsin-like peptidase domain-containing protein [Alteromonadaceae bacterium]|nr:trypsin-like peptidase domain-containing protein [Alteromonadaceae bacterium]
MLKYIIHSASYGVMFAVVILLLFPQLRSNSILALNIFQAPPPAQALSYAKAVNIAGPAVVNIYSTEIQTTPRYNRNPRQSIRLGSGVIMESSGYILTNFHVVQNANLIEVVIQNGQTYPAELIGFDIYTDLAVLKVNAVNLPVIPQNKQQASLAGDVVLAIGNPLNLGQTVTQGIISATGRSGLSNTSYQEFLQMDAAINEGNSGGALVNTNGILVGINTIKFTQLNPQLDIQGIFFAVPYQLAYKIMQKIIENGRVVRGWLGVSAREYRLNVKGFVIDEITASSPASIAGLKSGDVIYQIGETEITSITQALDIVAETKPNTSVIFKIYRDKQQFDIPVLIIENKLINYN